MRPCCHDSAPKMGNVYENDIKGIWNNEMYQEMRKRIDSENPFDCCKHCAMISRKVVDAKAFIIYNL